MNFNNIFDDLQILPNVRDNILKEILEILDISYFHFKQDFRFQLEHHTHIFGIYDYVSKDNDFSGYTNDIFDILDKHNNRPIKNDIKLMYNISNAISNYLKNIIITDFNYKINNYDNIDDAFDINMFSKVEEYMDEEVLEPL